MAPMHGTKLVAASATMTRSVTPMAGPGSAITRATPRRMQSITPRRRPLDAMRWNVISGSMVGRAGSGAAAAAGRGCRGRSVGAAAGAAAGRASRSSCQPDMPAFQTSVSGVTVPAAISRSSSVSSIGPMRSPPEA
jgi:hypothetical protein